MNNNDDEDFYDIFEKALLLGTMQYVFSSIGMSFLVLILQEMMKLTNGCRYVYKLYKNFYFMDNNSTCCILYKIWCFWIYLNLINKYYNCLLDLL